MKKLVFLFLLLLSGESFCQQLPQITQFQQNQYLFNPAATGAERYVNLSVGGRLQWVGMSDAPKTSFLYISTPADKFLSAFMKRTYGKVKRNDKAVRHPNMRVNSLIQAFGGQFIVDQFGAFRSIKMAGSYAVHIPLVNEFKLSFGTNIGLSSHSFLPSKAQVLNSITGSGTFDAIYGNQITSGSQNIMDIDAGLYFYGNGFYVGIAAMQLTRDLIKFGNLNSNYAPVSHFYGMIGYTFEPNNRLDIKPGALVKYELGSPLSVEGNVTFEFNDTYWFGTSYRHMDAVGMLAGVSFSDKFSIGYSYDLSISRLVKYNSGGHELVLRLKLGNSRGSFSRIN